MVSLFDTKAQNLALEGELAEAFSRVLRSGQFILGPEVEAFESECGDYLGCRHAIGVSSGTDAILLGLMALGVGAGDEVIVPDFSFFATAGCVTRVGAKPVFVDVCPVCFNVTPEAIAGAITPRTKAILPVHLFGQCCRIEEIVELAERRGIPVLEDAAQAFGARRNGRAGGTFGAFGAFSFFPTKNLGAFGDAGLLTTDDDERARKARILRVHGMEPKYYHPMVGGNFRLDALQAALLRVKLPHLDRYSRRRAENAAFYTRELAQIEGVAGPIESRDRCGIEPAVSSPLITLPATLAGNEHIWNQYTVRVHGGRRDDLVAALREAGIGAEIYYPRPLHAQECYASAADGTQLLPTHTATRLADEVLSLPIYPELTPEELGVVVEKLAAWTKQGAYVRREGLSKPEASSSPSLRAD